MTDKHEPGATRQYSAEQIAAMLTERGDEWAEADYAARLLEDQRKTLESQLMLKHLDKPRADGEKRMAVTEAEHRAFADPAYSEYLKHCSATRRDANKARVRYDSAKAFAELWRTEQSSLRTEMQSMSRTR